MCFYAIRAGASKTKIKGTWAEADLIIQKWNEKRRRGAILQVVEYKKFQTEADAQKFLRDGPNITAQKRNQKNNHIARIEKHVAYQDELTLAKEEGATIFHVDGCCNAQRTQLGVFCTEPSIAYSAKFTLVPLTAPRCELAACISALQMFLDRITYPQFKDRKLLHVYTDSSYAVSSLELAYTLWYPSGAWINTNGKPTKNVDLLMKAVELRRQIETDHGCVVEVKHLPGSINITADNLSRKAHVQEVFNLNQI